MKTKNISANQSGFTMLLMVAALGAGSLTYALSMQVQKVQMAKQRSQKLLTTEFDEFAKATIDAVEMNCTAIVADQTLNGDFDNTFLDKLDDFVPVSAKIRKGLVVSSTSRIPYNDQRQAPYADTVLTLTLTPEQEQKAGLASIKTQIYIVSQRTTDGSNKITKCWDYGAPAAMAFYVSAPCAVNVLANGFTVNNPDNCTGNDVIFHTAFLLCYMNYKNAATGACGKVCPGTGGPARDSVSGVACGTYPPLNSEGSRRLNIPGGDTALTAYQVTYPRPI